ncbi:MAG: YetF domain-containing protein [Actinomycetota bacterium]
MWFDNWADVLRVVAVGAAAYVTLVVVLRVSGKRTLAKLNAFDLVVTVALGSTLATILLNADVSYLEGASAFALLAALQFAAALISSRCRYGRLVLTSRPTQLLAQGRFDEAALRGARVSEAEVRQAVRASGYGDLSEIAAVVLETDGSLSVISLGQQGDRSAMADVHSGSSPVNS